MKSVKYIAFGIAGLVVVGGVAVFFLLQNLDSIVKTAIEKYGSEATGTKVAVQTVEIGLKTGQGSVRGLRVANPSGFSGDAIFSLGDVSLKLDTASLTGSLPVIQDIHVGAPQVLYEVNKEGKTNLDAIKKNLAAFGKSNGGGQKGASAPSGKEEPRFLVKRLVIEEGQAGLDLTAVGGERMETKLGKITLNNIGGRNGVTAAGLGEVVLKAMVKKLEQTAAREGAERMIREKLGGLEQGVGDKLGAGVKDAGSALKNMLGK